MANSGLPAVTAVNKIDRLDPARTVAGLAAAGELGVPGEIFPISAKRGTGVDELVAHLVELLPEGPFLYPPERAAPTSRSRSTWPSWCASRCCAARARSSRTRSRWRWPRSARTTDGLLVVAALMWAETESQKAILIGAGGSMVRAIGTAARKQIEAATGAPACTWTCGCGCARAGAATTRCWTGSASSSCENR